MTAVEFVGWLAQTPGSIALHESLYLYSIIETLHVLGILWFAGTIAMVDLRILGRMLRDTPIGEMLTKILPWTVAGFMLMTVTGAMLFYAIPVRNFHSVWLRLKIMLICLAALNIAFFHWRIRSDRKPWRRRTSAPLAMQVSAVMSLALWAAVIVTGRMIAYDWADCGRPQQSWINGFAQCPQVPSVRPVPPMPPMPPMPPVPVTKP